MTRGLLAVAAAALVACGATPARVGQVPAEEALSLSLDRVGAALAAARDASEEQEVWTFPARYNPTPACQCPDWEIRLRGRWTRVFFEATPDGTELLSLLGARAAEDHARGALGIWAVTGNLADDWRRDEVSGLTYPILRVRAGTPRDE